MANSNNTPTHRIYNVRDRGEGKKAAWTEIGVGFTNRDGSINLVMNAVPVDGKAQLRVIENKED